MDFGFGFKASSWMAYSMKGRCIKAAWSVCGLFTTSLNARMEHLCLN